MIIQQGNELQKSIVRQRVNINNVREKLEANLRNLAAMQTDPTRDGQKRFTPEVKNEFLRDIRSNLHELKRQDDFLAIARQHGYDVAVQHARPDLQLHHPHQSEAQPEELFGRGLQHMFLKYISVTAHIASSPAHQLGGGGKWWDPQYLGQGLGRPVSPSRVPLPLAGATRASKSLQSER